MILWREKVAAMIKVVGPQGVIERSRRIVWKLIQPYDRDRDNSLQAAMVKLALREAMFELSNVQLWAIFCLQRLLWVSWLEILVSRFETSNGMTTQHWPASVIVKVPIVRCQHRHIACELALTKCHHCFAAKRDMYQALGICFKMNIRY